MELTVLERFTALNLLPEEGNIVKIRMRMKLIEKIGLSAEELTEYDVKPGPTEGTVQWRQDIPQEKEIDEYDLKPGEVENTVQWKMDIPQEKDIDLKGPEIAAIAENLVKLNKDEKLTPQHLTLYEKFVDENED